MRRVALVAVAVMFVACGRGEPEADIALDGTPREPDRAGVVSKVTLEAVTIDGETIELSKKLLAFSTYTLAATPVLHSDGAYVHVGVSDGKVVWLAVIGRSVRGAGGASDVFYTGTVKRVDAKAKEVTFVDGTVLQAAPDVDIPAAGSQLLVTIDVAHDRITAVRSA